MKAEREEDADLTERERTKLNKDIASLEAVVKSGKPKLNNQNGPLVQALEKALIRHKTMKQSYHSRSFVGNHCSKYIKTFVQDDISATLQETTCEFSGNSDIKKRCDKSAKHSMN